jgi:hypothetical protein
MTERQILPGKGRAHPCNPINRVLRVNGLPHRPFGFRPIVDIPWHKSKLAAKS